MTILKILQYPDKLLRRTATKITNFDDPKLQKLIDDIVESVESNSSCMALASTQLQINDVPAIFVLSTKIFKNLENHCFLNPEIIEKSEETLLFTEGCMSVYHKYISAAVNRPKKIKLRAQNRKGDPILIEDEGILARCLQHEYDHLVGRVYLDLLPKVKQLMLMEKINKIREKECK